MRCFTHFHFSRFHQPYRMKSRQTKQNTNSTTTNNRLQIKKFCPSILTDKINSDSSPVICIIGKRNTGKSEVIRSLLYYNNTIPCGIVISPTETGNKFYSEFSPDSFIHHQFDPELMERVMKRQRKRVTKNGKIQSNNFFVILDDCMYESKEICGNKQIKEIFRNGRHFQITIIVTTQYVMDLPVALRSNVDYVFCMRENNVANIERLYRSFFGIFQTKQSFSEAFSVVTENYGSIVCDNLSRSNRIDKCIFWFCALYPCPQFRTGSNHFWKFHRKFYDQDHDKNDDDNDEGGVTLLT